MTKTLDLREVPINDRKLQMETLIPLLEEGEEMMVLADQDPIQLFQEFDQSKLVRSVKISEIEAGPSLWRTLVKAPKEGGCCGSCGG